MASSGLFSSIFVSDAMQPAVSDRAWLQAMLDAEAALAAAEARAGVIPTEAAQAIAAACGADRFDAAEIGRAGRRSGNPVVPLVRALSDAVGCDAAGYVHWGATSQDILDTAAMLVSRRASAIVLGDLDAVAAACARLADDHRATLMPGRTLLQQALPTAFGLKAAAWLAGVSEARRGLMRVRDDRLAVELGGAAGTLASLGDRGTEVLAEFARELDLREPELPWHTTRARVAELGAALAVVCGALAQTEVGEVAEPSGGGRGGSSAMPHKRNPIGSTVTRACAKRVQALAGVLFGAMAQEHERGAGGWHAEWMPLTEALALTGGASAHMREALEGLRVDTERMRANLELTGGLLMAEHVVLVLAERVGRERAREIVDGVVERVAGGGATLRDALIADRAVDLSEQEIDRALDPAGYLGSADAFIDRALAAYASGS